MLVLMEQAFCVGHEFALHDAIVLCHDSKEDLPSWVLVELARRSRAYVRGEKPTKRHGRHSSSRTEQAQLVADARCFRAVNNLRERGLTYLEAFEAASEELHLSSEAVTKTYYRHKRRVNAGSYYISMLYMDPDFVGYLLYNDALLESWW